jgi:hypothetical protein
MNMTIFKKLSLIITYYLIYEKHINFWAGRRPTRIRIAR